MIWPLSRWFNRRRADRKLVLLDCRIHGSHYYDCLQLVQANEIHKGDILRLQREPENEYDEYAIEVFDKHRRKIGYVPKNYNRVIAILMDQGCRVSATVTQVEPLAWEPVCIRIEWLR